MLLRLSVPIPSLESDTFQCYLNAVAPDLSEECHTDLQLMFLCIDKGYGQHLLKNPMILDAIIAKVRQTCDMGAISTELVDYGEV